MSTIAVDGLGLSGMDCTAASETARAAGVEAVDCVGGDPAPSADQVNTVYRVSPTGNIPPSQLLTLTFYVDQVAMPAPAAPTMAATVIAGRADPALVGRLHLPVGHRFGQRLQLHDHTVDPSSVDGPSFGPNVRNATVQADGNAGRDDHRHVHGDLLRRHGRPARVRPVR